MERLCKIRKLPDPDMIDTHERQMNDAYAVQGQRIAYKRKEVPDTVEERFL